VSKFEYFWAAILGAIIGSSVMVCCLTRELNPTVMGLIIATLVISFVIPIKLRKKRTKVLVKLIGLMENGLEPIKELTEKSNLKFNDPEELLAMKKQLETDMLLQEKICRLAVSLLRIKENSGVRLYSLRKNMGDETDYIFLLNRLFFEAERVDKYYMNSEFVSIIVKFLSALFEFMEENKDNKIKVG